MSNFICDECGIYIREGSGGHYVTGCEHYPIEKMNQPQTPDNEVAIQTHLIDILRSVPKSCREMIQDGEHSHRNIPYGRLCHEAATELAEKTNEVARLRELLGRAIGYTKNALFFARTYDNKIQWNEIDKLWDVIRDLEKEALAPAPEEPTTNHKGFSSKLVDEPKQEEMPLEDEIETLWEHSEHIDSLTGHMAFKALAKSIRYLRDEIQKLHETQDQHRKSLELFCNQLVDLKQK